MKSVNWHANCAAYEGYGVFINNYDMEVRRFLLLVNTMSRYLLPTHYFIPLGQIVDPGSKPEGYPLPFENDTAGNLPQFFGSKEYNSKGDTGFIVQRSFSDARSYDDSLAFGGVSGYNFLRRDCKPGAK